RSGHRRRRRPNMQGLLGRVAGWLPGGHRASNGGPAAIAALDIGTEFAKALVVTPEPGPDGTLIGAVRGVGRQRQGLSHMQSGTVTDIDAVVENTSRALAQAREMSGVERRRVVIGIAGELVKGTNASLESLGSDTRRAPA